MTDGVKHESVRHLMRALYATLGNKRYLNDIENLLDKLSDVSPEEEHALLLLANAIRDKDNELQRSQDQWRRALPYNSVGIPVAKR